MKRCVVFDHDGTLVNSLEVVVQNSNQVLRTFGKEPKLAKEIIAGMVHPTPPRLGILAGIHDPKVQADMAALYNRLAVEGSGLTTLYPGIDEMVKAIARAGICQAVLSNSAGAFIRTVLGRLGLAAHFIALVGDDDMPAPKPDPRGLLALLQQAGCQPSQAVYVGDSRTDLQTARAAGIHAIGVSWGAHPRSEIERLGFDAIVDSPSELLRAMGL